MIESLLQRLSLWASKPLFADGADLDGPFMLPYKEACELLINGKALKLPLPSLPSIRRAWPAVRETLLMQDEGLTLIMKKVVEKRSGAFIDVGMNFGQCLIRWASVSSEPYVGFEPSINCCRVAEQIIMLNHIQNASVFPIGLWKSSGLRTFFTHNRWGSLVASALDGYRPDGFFSDSFKVFLAEGDGLLDSMNLPSISMVKIDVEGGEPEVLEGLSRTIQKHRPYLYFEALPANTERALKQCGLQLNDSQIQFRQERLCHLENILKSINYEFAEVAADGKVVPCQALVPNEQEGLSNYVAGPRISDFLS